MFARRNTPSPTPRLGLAVFFLGFLGYLTYVAVANAKPPQPPIMAAASSTPITNC